MDKTFSKTIQPFIRQLVYFGRNHAAVSVGTYRKSVNIANVALFFASDEASFATSTVFVIDGGLTAGNH